MFQFLRNLRRSSRMRDRVTSRGSFFRPALEQLEARWLLNASGVISSMAFNQDFAIAANHHVLQHTSSGWQDLGGNAIQITAFQDNAGKTGVFCYAAVSGPGGGILKSQNAGASWTLRANATFDRARFGTLVVDPVNANILYVSVRSGPAAGGGVYRSTDGGLTWTNLTGGISRGAASDLVMDPTNPSILYAGFVHDYANPSTNGIYKTLPAKYTFTAANYGKHTFSET